MVQFSARSFFDTQPNRLTQAIERARGADELLDLTESNPTLAGLSPDAQALRILLESDTNARYEPEPFGLLAARTQIASMLSAQGFGLDPANVLLTASTSEAYSFLFKLLCDPADELLVPAPSYPLFDVLAQLEQVRLVPYPLRYDGEWHIDAAELARAKSARTRAVVTVHPNNPTGSFLKRDELESLAALELPIISDEVFVDYARDADPRRAISALELAPSRLVFRLSGLSKACALPQLKLAWTAIAGPAALVAAARARLEHIADSYLSPSTPVQLALPALLARAPATQARIRARLEQNLAALTSALQGSAASVLRVEGGWYAIVRAPALCDDEAWALMLLEQDRVLVQPGYYYELAGTHLVLSLLCEPVCFAEGVSRLVARIEALLRSQSP